MTAATSTSPIDSYAPLPLISDLDLGDRRIFFPTKATIKRRPRFTMDLDDPDAFPASIDSTTILIQDLIRHLVPAHDEPCLRGSASPSQIWAPIDNCARLHILRFRAFPPS